jgi:hypothetical protein
MRRRLIKFIIGDNPGHGKEGQAQKRRKNCQLSGRNSESSRKEFESNKETKSRKELARARARVKTEEKSCETHIISL